MAIPRAFEVLVSHPTPGLHFPPHRRTQTPERVVPAPHRLGRPATANAMQILAERIQDAPPGVQAQLVEFYSRWNGVDLCCLPDPLSGEPTGALRILPIAEWDDYTKELLTGDLSVLLEQLGDMYTPGRFIVIAANEDECTRLALFMHGATENMELAGKVYYLSMDPVLSPYDIVADGFFSLIESFAADPAAFLSRIGYTYVAFGKGAMYGDVPDHYLPDCSEALEGVSDSEDLGSSVEFDAGTRDAHKQEGDPPTPDEPLLPFMQAE